MIHKRKICFVITSPIHYSRNFLILNELKKREDVELHIVLGGSVLLSKHVSHDFNIKNILEKENYKFVYEVHFNLEGDNVITKSKTVGLGIVEFSSVFNEINPDVVVVRADRFEVLAATIAASYMNIPVAHIEGGDKSGTLDESVRHAITKLSHVHFATNEDAYERILRMGERKKYVFNFGSPDIEVAKKVLKENGNINLKNVGSGANFDFTKEYIMVMFHPVTSQIDNLSIYTREILKAVNKFDIQILWFWPNFDAGAEKISHELRLFNDQEVDHKIKFLRYLHPKKFLRLLSNARCLVGNSSAGIKECSYLGIPVVDIGQRQDNRLRAQNVIRCNNSNKEIEKAIRRQLKVGRYEQSCLYHSNDTSKEIARVLAKIKLYTQKEFID
ncbi:MAG: UDP-N-acetylglucosamine 2-epimerase [Parcubacteria group bacterium]|jgi:UDP-hydrolysing UDP-N-acetyl-D-glucosamine 2-epimerase